MGRGNSARGYPLSICRRGVDRNYGWLMEALLEMALRLDHAEDACLPITLAVAGPPSGVAA